MPFDGFNQFTQIVTGNSQVPRSQPCLGIDLGAADMIWYVEQAAALNLKKSAMW